MSSFLIFVPLPADQHELADKLIRSAECFLEAQGGSVERVEFGCFRRNGRGKSVDVLPLVALTAESAGDSTAEAGRARALEGVLRSTLSATGARSGDVRVFVSADELVRHDGGGDEQ